MKKLFAAGLMIILLFTVSNYKSHSQTIGHDHEFTVGVGFVTTDQVLGVFIDIFRALGTLGNVYSDNVNYTGALYLNYKYFFTPRFAAGLSVLTDKARGDLVNDDDQVLGSFNRRALTLAPEVSLSYVNRKSFRMYGMIGAGYTFGREKSTNDLGEDNYTSSYNHINFQLSPLGLRLGKQIGAFAEIGFGYKGILNIGISGYF
ncbi:MAG: hypothetical protein ACLFN1_02630 [Bacteroidales bacterium]